MVAGTPRGDWWTLAAFGLLVLLAGGNAVGIRYTNEELAPFWGAALRFGTAGLLFLGCAFVRRAAFPRGRALAGTLSYGALNFGASYGFVYWALVHVEAGLAQIVLGLVPLLTLLLAVAQGIERIHARGILGTLLAAGGIAVVFAGSATAGAPLLPLAAAVASAFCAAQAAIVVKRTPATHPLAMNALAMGIGTLILLGCSLVAREAWSVPTQTDTLAALGYLVVAGSFAVFALYLRVLARWTASATAYLFVLVPFVTIVVAAILRGERLTIAHAAGGALALVGVALGALWPRRAGGPGRPEA